MFCIHVKWPLPPADKPIAVNKYYYYYYYKNIMKFTPNKPPHLKLSHSTEAEISGLLIFSSEQLLLIAKFSEKKQP